MWTRLGVDVNLAGTRGAQVRVRREVNEHFVAIRVEQSERPDLAQRYRRHAWPATVFLRPSGDQLLALRGYRPVANFMPNLARVQ